MRSIRTQFIVFVGVLLLILLIMLNFIPTTSSRDQIFEEKRTSLSSRLAVISNSLSSLDSLSSGAVGDVLHFLDVTGLNGIMVTDKAGKSIYISSSDSKTFLREEDIFEALASTVVFRSVFTQSAFDSYAVSPVCCHGSVAGTVGIYEHDTERAEMLMEIQHRIRTISFFIGGVAIIIVLLFSEVLIRRIKELVNSIRIVADGDYAHRLITRGHDEITELGDEFNLLTERLDTTEKQRRRFVSDASHELKTPLAAIRLLSDSIVQSENMDPDTMLEFVSDIGNEAERLQHTTEKLLDLSRLDDGVQVVEEPVDIKQSVVDALSTLIPIAKEANVKFRCDLEDGCVVMATVEDMYHIVFNLMENAVKYNISGGSVHIVLTSDGSTVTLAVEDTGIGIPEEDRLNIFSRFYRVDKARSREAGGSGLGLSIVHDSVIAHGGTITVGSNKPQGTVFTVNFPQPTPEETGI